MATHHLSAVDVEVARGWQPMDTFPRDGSMVDITDAEGRICKAMWMDKKMRIAHQGIATPVNWRWPEE